MSDPENLSSFSAPATQKLEREITDLIIQSVNLQHMAQEGIAPELALTQGGLNLDSVDILEIVVAIEQKYQVKVNDAEVGRKYFTNIRGIAEFVRLRSPLLQS